MQCLFWFDELNPIYFPPYLCTSKKHASELLFDNYLGVFHIARGDISCFRVNPLFTTCDFIVETFKDWLVLLPVMKRMCPAEEIERSRSNQRIDPGSMIFAVVQ